MHNFKLGDKVYYPVNAAPFEVVGIRKTIVEIEGDFSGGTHNVTQRNWVSYTEIKPYNTTKVNNFKLSLIDKGQIGAYVTLFELGIHVPVATENPRKMIEENADEISQLIKEKIYAELSKIDDAICISDTIICDDDDYKEIVTDIEKHYTPNDKAPHNINK